MLACLISKKAAANAKDICGTADASGTRGASTRLPNIVLLIASLAFYAWGGVKYAIILCISTVVNYLLGLLIGKNKSKAWMTVGVIWNIGILFWFKYMNAFVPSLNIVLPVGISFFTFQILSYLFDVYYGHADVQHSVTDLALYIMMFPQLIAGPIVRYTDVNAGIAARSTTPEMLHDGILRFMMGFIKKVFLANSMGLVADKVFEGIKWLNTGTAWLGIISYALQIYLDFSAYSDMAIGLGMIFGFNFRENFNYPYIAQSVKEFWRRWHMSLSTWFRDYVYIPLGGNRKGEARTIINLFIVFLLTGIWHGSTWNFVLWGVYYAVILIAERLFLGKALEKCPRIVRHIYTLLLVIIGWVFFRAETLPDAWAYLRAMFACNFTDYGTFGLYELLDREYITMLVISLIISMPVVRTVLEKTKRSQVTALVSDIVIVGLFILAVLYMTGANYNPFIYFRF